MEIKPIELVDALAFTAGVPNGALITLRRDGRPQSSEVHHGVLDGTIVFSVLPTRAKVFNIERDPRVVYHVSHEGSYLSFDGTAEVSPIPTKREGPAMDTLVDAFRAVAKKEHPDWDEFREAMVRERRRVITVTPTSVVGLIRPVWR
ncbi:MAG: TIGR03618 family F420-dependent PPOX class oxidoreductase [Acidimicrobiales bacterium]|nr:TIGR03618 family F420-dependent PPOX class oxidoreductase [Acidimicrobiales bacterium]